MADANFHEKRKHPRVDARIKVAFRTLSEFSHEYTRNISSGGIFLKTDRLVDPNAEIELEIEFPDGMGRFQVRGKVARLMTLSNPEEPGKMFFGVGVRFIDPSPTMIAVIERIIAMNSGLNKPKDLR